MASNPPQQSGQPGGKHELFGLPIWAYALGGLAFVVAIFVIYRRGSSSGTSAGAQGVPMSGVTPLPFSNANTSTQPTQSQALAWQFGPPPNNPNSWVWEPTEVGQENFQKTRGGPYTGGIQPGTVDPNQFGFGQFGWQWAPLPGGESFQQFTTGQAPSTNSGQGIFAATGTNPQFPPGFIEGNRAEQIATYPPSSLVSNINSTTMPAAVG